MKIGEVQHPTTRPTTRPTGRPTYGVAPVPARPGRGYFNYDPGSRYGPEGWKRIDDVVRGDPGYFWHTFDMEDSGGVSNDCGSRKKQSPIDLCVKPRDSCTETHEMRPKVCCSSEDDLGASFVCLVPNPRFTRNNAMKCAYHVVQRLQDGQ